MWSESIILIPLALVVVANAKGLNFENCGGKAQIDFRLDDCAAPPCKLYAGQNHTLDATFRAHGYTTTLNFEALVEIPPFRNVPITVRYGNFCNHLVGKSCPLQRGTRYHVHYGFHVPSYVPDIHILGSIVVKNSRGKILRCGRMPIYVVGGKFSNTFNPFKL